MLIIIILNFIVFYLIKKYNLFNTKKSRVILYSSVLIEIVLFVVYRINLAQLGREVYFSDAETYWKNTLEILTTGHSDGYNNLYYRLCALIQKTSPFLWVGWNNLFNITCLNLSFILIATFVQKTDSSEKKLQIFTLFSLANPFIVFGLMRNLKDSLFLLMVVVTCFIADYYCKTKNKILKVFILAALLLMAYVFTDIRPWGFIIPIIAILYIVQYQKRKKYQFDYKSILILISVALLVGAAIIFAVPSIANNIKIWAPITLSSSADRGLLSTIVGLGKFMLAPGPIRALLGNDFFEHSMLSGNIMAGVGSLIWWLSLIPITVAIVTQKEKIKLIFKKDGFLKLILISALFYLIIYTMQYGGSGELRLKSVFYIFFYAIVFQLYDIPDFSQHKKTTILVTCLLSLVFITTSIIGLIGA